MIKVGPLVPVVAAALVLSACKSPAEAVSPSPSAGCPRIAEDYAGPIPRGECNPLNMTPVELGSLTSRRFSTAWDLTSAAEAAGWSCEEDKPMWMGNGLVECDPKYGTVKLKFFVADDKTSENYFANKVDEVMTTPAPKDKLIYVVIGSNWMIYGLFGTNFVPTLPSSLHLDGEVRKIPTHPYSSRAVPTTEP